MDTGETGDRFACVCVLPLVNVVRECKRRRRIKSLGDCNIRGSRSACEPFMSLGRTPSTTMEKIMFLVRLVPTLIERVFDFLRSFAAFRRVVCAPKRTSRSPPPLPGLRSGNEPRAISVHLLSLNCSANRVANQPRARTLYASYQLVSPSPSPHSTPTPVPVPTPRSNR